MSEAVVSWMSVCHVITANWRSHNLTMYSWSGPSMMKLHLKEHCRLLPDLYFPNFCPGQVCCCWRFHIIIEPPFLVCIVRSKLVVQKLTFQCITSCNTLWWSYLWCICMCAGCLQYLLKITIFLCQFGGSQLQTVILGYHQLLLSATFTFTY